jgi:hypothetical protein
MALPVSRYRISRRLRPSTRARDVRGIRLEPNILPFSNIPAFFPLYWLSRNTVMAVKRR